MSEDVLKNRINKLTKALNPLDVVKVLDTGGFDGQVWIKLRVHNKSRWNHISTLLLKEQRRSDWSLFIGTQLELDKKDVLKYAWRFYIQSDELDNAIKDVCRVLDLAQEGMKLFSTTTRKNSTVEPPKKSNGELTEYPLFAPSNRRGGSEVR